MQIKKYSRHEASHGSIFTLSTVFLHKISTGIWYTGVRKVKQGLVIVNQAQN